jgi:hypothetical protein
MEGRAGRSEQRVVNRQPGNQESGDQERGKRGFGLGFWAGFELAPF